MENVSSSLLGVTIGALFHDIGKVIQKTKTTNERKGEAARAKEAGVNYAHALYSKAFFGEHTFFHGDSSAYESAAYHHVREHNDFADIIAEGDRRSSGAERKEDASYTGELPEAKIHAPLRSVFSEIAFSTGVAKSGNALYAARKLDLENEAKIKASLFPTNDAKNTSDTYKQLYDAFKHDVRALEKTPPYIYVGALISLLERYLWAIPASSRKEDGLDVSLFDHSLTTAAIASALYVYNDRNRLSGYDEAHNGTMKKYRLVFGDVSGIQNYIFRLKHGAVNKAAKTLRGRSFMVGMLTDVVVHHILSSLGYTPANKVMSAGGRFVLLVDNTDETCEQLNAIIKDVEREFYERYLGEISVTVDASVALSGNDFSIGEREGENVTAFRAKYYEANDALERKKQAKFSSVLFAGGDVARHDNEYYDGEKGVCSVCGVRAGKYADEEKKDEYVCPICLREQEIGKALVDAGIVAIVKEENRAKTDLFNYRLIFDEDDLDAYNESSVLYVEALNVVSTKYPTKVTANYVPLYINGLYPESEAKWNALMKNTSDAALKLHSGAPLTFAHIGVTSQSLEKGGLVGEDFIGVLKADVDRLGFIFSQGLRDRFSIARYATLSRMLNLYFAAYVPALLEERFPYTYTVFAGGDDLLLVGPWKEGLTLAKEVNGFFRNYTCDNPDITLSAGYVLSHQRYPIHLVADFAEEELEHSKERGRNRFTCFGTTVEWAQFKTIDEWHTLLREGIEADVPKGLVYALLSYRAMYEDWRIYREAVKHGKPDQMRDVRSLLWKSLLQYAVKRNITRQKKHMKDEAIAEKVENALLSLTESDEKAQALSFLNIPISWTLYAQRRNK